MNHQAILAMLRSRVPDLLAIYAFGSRVQGTAGAQSDLDLAVLVAGYAEPLALWTLASDLADVAGCPVDLLDLRAASTVMQHQIITTGERWWAGDSQAALYEAAMLSEKTELDTARAGLLGDIEKRGTIYGKYVLDKRMIGVHDCIYTGAIACLQQFIPPLDSLTTMPRASILSLSTGRMALSARIAAPPSAIVA